MADAAHKDEKERGSVQSNNDRLEYYIERII